MKHNGISFVNGSFNSFEGFVKGDLNSLENAKIEFTVNVESIDTHIEPCDTHLCSADFSISKKLATRKNSGQR